MPQKREVKSTLKSLFFSISMLTILCFKVTVSASESAQPVPISDNTQSQTPENPGVHISDDCLEAAPNQSLAIPVIPPPINVERKNINGSEYLVKTYRADPGFDPALLVEDGYELDGYLFAHIATEKQKNKTQETKEHSEIVQVETQSDSLVDILQRLPSSKTYDTDGFTGTLTLDTASIRTEVAGYATKPSTISAVQEYIGLMYKDPSYVPQTVNKDGHTLSLSDVQWTVIGTSLADDNTLVPNEYKATVTYTKAVSSQVPAGYITSVVYTGSINKMAVDSIDYTLTYIGTPIREPTITPAPTPIPTSTAAPTPPPIQTDTPEQPGLFETIPWSALLSVLIILTAAGSLAAGLFLLFRYIRKLQGVQIYNLIDRDYICIGRQVVDYKKPVLDLNYFKDIIQSNSFSFVMNKSDCKKLYGRNIAVTLDDVTVMHLIKGYNEEYRFNLELGGILDVR